MTATPATGVIADGTSAAVLRAVIEDLNGASTVTDPNGVAVASLASLAADTTACFDAGVTATALAISDRNRDGHADITLTSAQGVVPVAGSCSP